MPPTLQLDRRTLLRSLLSLSLASAFTGNGIAAAEIGERLPGRGAGEMDIHHIDTGRGNCTLLVAPDGTTIMIDAGAVASAPETSGQPRPNSSRRPGEWQASYARRHTPHGALDYAILTHVHPDHVGDLTPDSPRAAGGTYRLTGISDVDAILPVGTVIDRAFPAYGDTEPPASAFAENYFAFLQARQDSGRSVQAATVGSDRQVQLRTPSDTPFKLRFLAGNGRVWTGHGLDATTARPALRTLAAADRPGENFYSLALRVTYGRFSYYTGGDLSSDTEDGRLPWLDIETPVARRAGRTEVAAANHHGYFDSCGPAFVQALDAQAYLIQAWDVGHSGTAQLQRLTGAWHGKATHDVFATDLLPANALINRRFAPMLKSQRGHVIVRVASGGGSFRIFVVDSDREDGDVRAVFGPYLCRT